MPVHAIQRGNNRQAIFFADEDYAQYLRCLKLAAKKHDCRIHAYVLMTNHVHLLLTPTQAQGVGEFFQTIGRHYVAYINQTYQRTGTLWVGRYKASLIDKEHYLFSCYRYIEFNPVRAGMVRLPEHYPWSSLSRQCLEGTQCVFMPASALFATRAGR
ncbi:transposase [Methylomonas rivi]|uniref:Transposase n=1 Tax=Methylomonas rivi TaxID=2952226 RepID=A0ABT1UA50_9GAMM|nr:transposase [Methylomonas sp. WSC-6]